MAKRKPLRDFRKPVASTKPQQLSPCPEHDQLINKTKRRVRQAHEKHKYDNINNNNNNSLWPTRPTLADRLHALPPELRAQIFSKALVQPCKWEIEHQDDCPLRNSSVNLTPYTCNRYCGGGARHFAHWRRITRAGVPATVSPWSSKWAPGHTNPYLCSDCSERFRARPFPKASSLPCLCARRDGLEILLVCKQWYAEAGRVFYTANIFAFENASTFAAFVRTLNPKWRGVVSKVSIMALSFEMRPDEVLARTDVGHAGYLRQRQTGPSMWSLLRDLPSLSYLELDHIFLSNAKVVRNMTKLGLRNLRCLRFSRRLQDWDPQWTSGTPTVWPHVAGRTLVSGGFVEEVARTIKGQRQRRLKRGLEGAVREYNEQLEEETRKKGGE
ncbi:Hypothetical predicted protein [Lecanosticta acicola]|uniref:Uncharacterized protein n=1 Tax=Lecanosticta acicola TaxID=111012 RepID=A0AAI9EDR7_9PEZI|nr:Hypothetical predicted protein [Lecanosticta acicola]